MRPSLPFVRLIGRLPSRSTLAWALDQVLKACDRRDAQIATLEDHVQRLQRENAQLLDAQDGYEQANRTMHKQMCAANLEASILRRELREATS